MAQDSQTMRFRCPGCSATMRGTTAESGEKRKCPKCKTTFRIPGADGAETAVPKPPVKKKEQPLVPVVCGVCNTRIYANLDQVGTSVECPDCFTQNLVKPPEKKKPKSGPDLAKIGEYDLAPAQEIKIIQTSGEERLEEADELVQQELDAAPQMPDKPFLHGIFLYPFRGDVLPSLIGMAMAWTFFVFLIVFAWGLEGFASAVAPFILAVAAFMLALVIIPSLVTFQKIMENGANGDDETEIRPDGGLFAMVDWVVDVLPVVIAATVSCVPTLGMFHFGLFTTGAEVPWGGAIEMGLGYLAFLIFPLLFLSMLENNSILGLYSGHVWGSLAKQVGAWMKFVCLATVLYVGMVAIGFGIYKLVAMDMNTLSISGAIFAMAALICLLAVYFRLLGRLAFVLTFRDRVPSKHERSADAALA